MNKSEFSRAVMNDGGYDGMVCLRCGLEEGTASVPGALRRSGANASKEVRGVWSMDGEAGMLTQFIVEVDACA